MRKISIITIVMLIHAASTIATAQDELLFHSFDEQDGLASDQVSCLEVDDFGYLWIGSTTALTRYDGREFKLYSSTPENMTNVVTGNAIAHIKKDRHGNLWFATEKGVSVFDIINSKFNYLPIDLKDDTQEVDEYQADKIFITSDNKKYCFSPINYIMKYDASTGMMKPTDWDYFKTHTAHFCEMDNDDCFWTFDEENNIITRLDTSGRVLTLIECDKHGTGNLSKNHYGFMDNGNGEYWFGCTLGLFIWNDKTKSFGRLKGKNYEVFHDYEIKCIYKDSRGIIWIGTNAKETFTYDPGEQVFKLINHSVARSPFRLNSPTVIDIKEDSRGLLWFGTWRGVSFTELSPSKKFHNVSNDNLILDERNYISSFDSHNSMIAIGCDGGGTTFWRKGAPTPMVHIDPKDIPWSKAETGSSLAIAYDSQGYCYTGGFNRSVTRIHPNLRDIDQYTVKPKVEGALQHDFTSDIICDSHDRIWILSNGGGLCEVTDKKTGTVKYHNTDRNGNMHSGVCGTALCQYDDHTILVGSYIGFSVYDIDNDVFTNYRSKINDSTSLSHNWVYYFCVDKKKRIWIGTCSGLNKFDINTGKFVRYGRESGLMSDVIKGILEDEKTGLLWLSTAKGITKFDPEKGVALRTYLISDGLLSENFMTRAAHKAADGTMYFGMANGFTYFRPDEIRDDTILPMPTITGMLINYERVTPQDTESPLSKAPEAIDKIVLNNYQSTFTIEFTSLNFVNERGNHYSYLMKGFNQNWIDIGTRHEVTFTNLDQGEYVFMVRCTNSDGVVSDIRPLLVVIRPPFYRTWWFLILSLMLSFGMVTLLVRIRTKSMKERQAILENTVKERTEEILSANKALEDQKEEIEKALNSTLILNDLSRQITSSFDVPTILSIAYSHIKMMSKMDFFAMGTYSPSKNILEFNHIKYGALELEPVEIGINEKYTETECFSSSEDCYLTGDTCANSRFRNIEGEIFGTVFILPLHEASHINGVLAIACHKADCYSKTERANLRMITSYMSIALEKAKDYHQLRIKNNAINGSIRYAKTIQEAILVHEKQINKYFNAMVIYRPKDIVSGDFYWFNVIGDPEKPTSIFAADIDCTGHGVPGAFMSLISNILLNDIVIRNANHEPNLILAQLHREIILALNQAQNLNDDGLDMSLCRFDLDGNGKCTKVVFAGAKNSLYHYRADTGEIEILAADRLSIGGFNNLSEKEFTNHEIEPHEGDTFYMSSDGIIDQNDKKRKRFGRKRLVDLIIENHSLDMAGQKARLEQALNEFMDGEEQRDDISVMGIKL